MKLTLGWGCPRAVGIGRFFLLRHKYIKISKAYVYDLQQQQQQQKQVLEKSSLNRFVFCLCFVQNQKTILFTNKGWPCPPINGFLGKQKSLSRTIIKGINQCARCLIGSRIIECAAYCNQKLLTYLYLNSTQNTSFNWIDYCYHFYEGPKWFY